MAECSTATVMSFRWDPHYLSLPWDWNGRSLDSHPPNKPMVLLVGWPLLPLLFLTAVTLAARMDIVAEGVVEFDLDATTHLFFNVLNDRLQVAHRRS